jgi:hypothetical protein
MRFVFGIMISMFVMTSGFSQQLYEINKGSNNVQEKGFYFKNAELDSNKTDLLMFNFFSYFTARGFDSYMHINGVDVYGNRADGLMNYKAKMVYADKTLSVSFSYMRKGLASIEGSDPNDRTVYTESVRDSLNSFYEGAKVAANDFFKEVNGK